MIFEDRAELLLFRFALILIKKVWLIIFYKSDRLRLARAPKTLVGPLIPPGKMVLA